MTYVLAVNTARLTREHGKTLFEKLKKKKNLKMTSVLAVDMSYPGAWQAGAGSPLSAVCCPLQAV